MKPGPKKKQDSYYYNIDQNGCWIWKFCKTHNEYGRITVNMKTLRAHRYFYEKYKNKIPINMELDHICRQKLCVNPNHLEIVTRAENARRSPNTTKLDYRKVKEIKELYNKGVGQYELAEIFSVRQPCISRIINGKRWIAI